MAADDSLVLVLVEDKLDSRTKFAKTAKQKGWLREFVIEVDRYGKIKDYTGQKSIQFVLEQAKKLNLKCNRTLAQYLYQRVGADPWELYGALERLQIVGEVSRQAIDQYIPTSPTVNVFEVLNLAFRGQREVVEQAVVDLERTDAEPRLFFGLLASQIFNILAIASAPAGANLVADFGLNSFAVSQLSAITRDHSLEELKQVTQWFIEVDTKLKSGSYDAWLEIKVLLNRIVELTS